MPRNKPKLLESPLVREERAKKSSALSKKRKSPLVDSAQLTQEQQRGVNRTEMARENADSVAAHSNASGGGSAANTVGGGEETTSVWTAHVDRNTKRTYYHNHLTKESVWTKPQELTTALRSVTCTTSASENSRVSDPSVDALGTPARGGAAGDSGAAGAAMAASGATEGKDPISRLRRAIEKGQLDPVSFKRLQALFMLLRNCEKTKCVVLRTAIVPEENCFLGFASLVVSDEAAFNVQLQQLVQANEGGIWTTCPVGEGVEAHLRAESIMTHLLRTIHVFPGVSSSKSWNFDKEKDVEHVAHAAAAHVHSATSETHGKAPFEQLADLAIVGSMTDAAQATQAAPHSAVSAGGSIEGGIKHAVTAASASHHPTPHAQHARQEQSQVQQAQQVEQSSAAHPGARAMTSIASIAAKNRAEKSARAAEQAALEAVQREREEALNREQWDAYENNLLSNVANGMQSGTVMARIGSLTVRRLGKIKVDDDSYHSELAIYPVGYMSNRVCFAPGEIQSKTGVACRRAVYKCQILMGHQGGAPLFQVTVENQAFHGTSASQAWELATRRPLRERKKLKVHANEGQCDNVTEMFMACSYAIDGDYMFGVTVGPIAHVLEALKESTLLFNYHPRFEIWGKDYVRPNLAGCARAEPFKRRKKMSTAKTLRSAEPVGGGSTTEDEPEQKNRRDLKKLYERLRAEPRTVVQRSPIHNLGLFCTRDIEKHDMVIEYVGELVRPVVGDIRDDLALVQGKSTYMFRIDDDYIVDAMFKGNASRFMNHCCEPNCYCQVVMVDGVKHIVLFAKRPLIKGEEIMYDYKLPIEEIKIICHCGARNCRGYMN